MLASVRVCSRLALCSSLRPSTAQLNFRYCLAMKQPAAKKTQSDISKFFGKSPAGAAKAPRLAASAVKQPTASAAQVFTQLEDFKGELNACEKKGPLRRRSQHRSHRTPPARSPPELQRALSDLGRPRHNLFLITVSVALQELQSFCCALLFRSCKPQVAWLEAIG